METIVNTIQEQYVNLLASNEEEFETFLEAGNVDEAKARMDYRGITCELALKEYDPEQHRIIQRESKVIYNEKGEVVDHKKQWALPSADAIYINEIALVFLFGRPLLWKQNSENTDDAFSKFKRVLKDTHFNSHIRQCKRVAGSETESALLFRVYRDDDGQPAMQLRVLAHSAGDEIYTRFDQYRNLISFAWGYYVKIAGDITEYHFDVYTKKRNFYCTQKKNGWVVDIEENIIGKIPVILFRQEKEWKGVERLIHRLETIVSKSADTNDYFADPALVAMADLILGLPEKDQSGKVYAVKNYDGDVSKALKYLTWDSAPQSKIDERTWLQEQILTKTFTPDIKLDTLKSLGNLSGKALQTVMLLAKVKADRRKETYDEMIDRTTSLLITIIANVLDVKLKPQCDQLEIDHIWQEPFGEDIENAIDNIVKAHDGGILSTESAIELNPLVTDSIAEKKRLDEEQAERQRQQDSLFGAAPGKATADNPSNPQDEDEGED